MPEFMPLYTGIPEVLYRMQEPNIPAKRTLKPKPTPGVQMEGCFYNRRTCYPSEMER